MKNPPHPGLSVTEAAAILNVSRKQLSDLVNCHAGISPEMAIRLDKAFGGGAETVDAGILRHGAGLEERSSLLTDAVGTVFISRFKAPWLAIP